MSFDIKTKTNAFLRCARICCLCFKQCGSKIEAAHIVSGKAGGPSDDDNCIPLCFDCHADIGAYNDKHPKGNKYRPKELKARRDQVYTVVESGALLAQIIAARSKEDAGGGVPSLRDLRIPKKPTPSSEAARYANKILSDSVPTDALDRKLKLLSDTDRAYVIDTLVKECSNTPAAVRALARITASEDMDRNESLVVTERLVREIVLFGTVESKAELLKEGNDKTLSVLDETIRIGLFEDLFSIIDRDQFQEVNILVPGLVKHEESIPPILYGRYVETLFDQAGSQSWNGAPTARRALKDLPKEIARAGIRKIDLKVVERNDKNEWFRTFVENHIRLAHKSQTSLLRDYLNLSYREFWRKY